MIECKYCKTQNKDDYIYCMNCGRKLPKQGEDKKDLKALLGNKKILIAAAAVVLLAIIVIFALPKGSNKDDYLLFQKRAQVWETDKTVYVFDGSSRKEVFESVSLVRRTYSFDSKTVLINYKDDGVGYLYVYRDNKLNLISNEFNNTLLSDNGETVLYTDEANRAIHLYSVNKQIDTVAFVDEEKEYDLDAFVLSYSGSVLAYTKTDDEGRTLNVYTSSGTTEYPADEIYNLICVSEKGDVCYVDGEDALHMINSKGDVIISEKADYICLNYDNSQIVTISDEEIVFFKDGKMRFVSFDEENSGIYQIVIPKKTLAYSYIRYGQGKQYKPVYHYGISDFEKCYYVTDEKNLVYFDKELKMQRIADNVSAPLISNDGKNLFYIDEEGSVHKYDGKDTVYYSSEEGCTELFAYDEKNKILYLEEGHDKMGYCDGKGFTELGVYNPDISLICNDGYFYFNDGKKLLAYKKGGEVIEVIDLYSSVTQSNEFDYFGLEGINVKAADKDYYFIKNAQIEKLDLTLEEEGLQV